MSTDTYIDFHSPESWDRWPNWGLWSPFLREAELSGERGHYIPYRVGYVYNLIMDCNCGLYDAMTEELNGSVVDDGLIFNLIKQWTVLYNQAQCPPQERLNDNLFCREDLMSPAELNELLEEYRGFHICFRVD